LVDARRQPDNPLNSVILYLERTLNRVSAFTHFDPTRDNSQKISVTELCHHRTRTLNRISTLTHLDPTTRSVRIVELCHPSPPTDSIYLVAGQLRTDFALHSYFVRTVEP
ncbi:hypothetical protein PGTUg99_000051, partial [Puccinia graminis f. sp. tritici]